MTVPGSAPAPRRFEGQVVVVTGAARGIGLAIAEAFAREGAALALADAADEPLHDVVARPTRRRRRRQT